MIVDVAVLALTEGDAQGAFMGILGLASRPLANVTLRVTSSLPQLITVSPAVLTVVRGAWNQATPTVQVRALVGKYGGQVSSSITVTAESADPKYNGLTASRVVTVALTSTQAEVLLNHHR